MNRKILLTLLAASALALSLSGCTPDNGKQAAASLPPKAASSQSLPPAESEATLTYYKANDDGTKIIPVAAKVKAKDRTAKTAMEEMIRTDRKSKYPVLPAGLSLKSIAIKEGTAYVDFSKELNEIKGSTGESLFIAMTADTLTEFPNIKVVIIRAEGKAPKFQMDMTKPFKRDESYIQMEKK